MVTYTHQSADIAIAPHVNRLTEASSVHPSYRPHPTPSRVLSFEPNFFSLQRKAMAATLIALPAVERLSPRCIRILGGNPGKYTLQGTNTYLLGTGPRRILIDTGEGKPAWLNSLRSTLEQEEATVENGVTLTASHTPGHTADHMVFIMAEENAMFTADNVLGQGTTVFEDLPAYMASLAKMNTLFKGRAYPGHGPVLEDGPGKIKEYIEHRRLREQQVLTTLGSEGESAAAGKPWTAMDMVRSIYRDIPESLHAAAHGGLLQTLGKLEGEGKVVRTGDDGWRLPNDKPAL
ncbi:hypothetical protein NLU13_8308 [Sarocladium strictum]|uniref:LACTB2 winged helix domain-containing protein n=1 Tax=Sarocladium strictum TaxID=5046 RepID=A0AA39GBF0_SARSR|nr:hypothetical protein NLU13_8308 [Sarocladium strictum]